MKRMDGRKRSQSAQEQIRLIAVARVRAGERPGAVIKSLGLNRTTIYAWLKTQKRGGARSLKSRKRTGRRPTLTAVQREQVRRFIQGKDPRQYGFDFGLWTRLIVCEMILERFGVTLSVTSVGRLLHSLGITPQKPLQRAYERDPVAVKQWVENRYPTLKKRAAESGATIFFLDEAGFRSDEPRGRTWGVRGETPVLATSGRRQQVNAISAVTASGAFWWDTFAGTLTATRFGEFLRKFMKGRRNPVYLVLDGHSSHRAKSVRALVDKLKGRLELHFLPGYAPDLNPDELVWQYVKRNGVRSRPLQADESLTVRVRDDLAKLARSPSTVRSFFHDRSVLYILN